MTRPRWLWISAEVSNEPTTGLLVYSFRLSRALADRVDITMVGIGPASTSRPELTVKPVPGSLRGGAASLFSTLPNLSFACATPEMRAAVQAELDHGGWDAIVIDHLQTAWVCEMLADGPPVIFITHNHETSMRRAVASEVPLWTPKGLPLRLDARKAGRLEHKALEDATVITSITEADQEKFRAAAPSKRHVLVKPGWSGDIPEQVTPLADRPRRVGIIGSFEWHVKQENLHRFVRDAGPALDSAGIELAIAGTVPEDLAERLQQACPAVTIVGWVASVEEFLGGCRIGVVAEPLGGGFKLKSLDYVALRVPIAATTGSLEGLPLVGGESMIESDTELKLGAAIVDWIDRPAELEELAKAAISCCSPTLRWEHQVSSLTESLL